MLCLFLTHFKEEDVVKKPKAKDTKPPIPTTTKSASGKGKGTGKGKATSKDKKIKNMKRATEVASLHASSPYADENEKKEDLGRGMRHKKPKK